MIVCIDHVQLAMPPGGEDAARGFYGAVLGMSEVPKPAPMAARGGCWFELGAVKLHLGVEQDFRPAKKAHPALVVTEFAAFCARLRAFGIEVADDREMPGVERAFVADPFGNRIELVGADGLEPPTLSV